MDLPIKSTSLPSALSFLTFNVWFDRLERQKRCLSILDHIVKLKPSIVCLQEVTATFLSFVNEVIMNPQDEHQRNISKQILDMYLVTGDLTNPKSVIPSYGVFMFIQNTLPVSKLENLQLPTMMDRTCLVSTLQFNNNVSVAVATVHLESLDAPKIRRSQLEIIIEHLKGCSHVFLMGDFNFDSRRNYYIDENPLENNVLKEVCYDYKDTWEELRGDDPGYTFDTTKNPMLQGHRLEQMRYDRIIYKSKLNDKSNSLFKAESIDIVGTEPISKDMPYILPSDHFGLFSIFKTIQ